MKDQTEIHDSEDESIGEENPLRAATPPDELIKAHWLPDDQDIESSDGYCQDILSENIGLGDANEKQGEKQPFLIQNYQSVDIVRQNQAPCLVLEDLAIPQEGCTQPQKQDCLGTS